MPRSCLIDYVAFSTDGGWLAAQSETNAVVWQVLTVNGDAPAAFTEED